MSLFNNELIFLTDMSVLCQIYTKIIHENNAMTKYLPFFCLTFPNNSREETTAQHMKGNRQKCYL